MTIVVLSPCKNKDIWQQKRRMRIRLKLWESFSRRRLQVNWPYIVTTIFMLGTMCVVEDQLDQDQWAILQKQSWERKAFFGLSESQYIKYIKKEHYASQWHHLLTTVPFAWWWLDTDLLIHQLFWSCFCVFVFVFWVLYFCVWKYFCGFVCAVHFLKDTSFGPNIFSLISL